MLSTMTKEGDAERTDREVLVPWIKFLWDTFRTVLDILRTNSKPELLYHKGTSFLLSLSVLLSYDTNQVAFTSEILCLKPTRCESS